MGQIEKSINNIELVEKVNELSVVLYTDSFFYGLWTDNHQLVKSDEHSIANFDQLLKIWDNNFNLEMVRVLSTQKPYVHLLGDDYEEQYFEDYFKGIYNVKRKKAYDREVDSFFSPTTHTLHYLQPQVVDALSQYEFPFKMAHISSALANYAVLKKCNLLVFVNESDLHLAYVKDGKFKFYNQFYCKSSTDYLYYILLLLKAHNLDPKDQDVCLGGHVSQNSYLFEQLSGYLGKIKVIDQNIQISSSRDIDYQLFFDLYLCRTCV
ncbi:MAG: DUF3822 family protein [Saprospiraceae bacterium]|nr:DUF3822 family protein [Bacteroidia bacterium]NNE16381.1 DUF3822 family protein [Saprospiraceae bacterium]NNL93515.1 DUF3822 family protein [Saprospiraceae bacterium]